MKKLNYGIIVLIIFICYSCMNTDKKLYKYIDKHCNSNITEPCFIDIKDALKVDYDEMYFFGETTSKDEIAYILGIPYENDKYIRDSEYRIILLKNKKIVYEDDYYQKCTFFSDVKDAEINIVPTVYCRKYTSSVFQVINEKSDKKIYIEGGRVIYIQCK